MKKLLNDRRTFIAFIAIGCLTALGFYHGMDTGIAVAMSGIVASVAASNAFESTQNTKNNKPANPFN